MCFRGIGSYIFLNVLIITDLDALTPCYKHYCKEIESLAKSLSFAFKVMETSKLHNEVLMQPVCTRLVLDVYSNSWLISNDNGVTLGETHEPLIRAFKHEVVEVQQRLRTVRSNDGGAWTFIPNHFGQRELAFAVLDCIEVGNMFDDTVKEVDKLMQEVPCWGNEQVHT
jgi:hypothetical protein